MGRACGGLTTKVHAMVDANGLPIGLRLSEGQAYDGHSAHFMLDTLAAGSILLADRGYYQFQINSLALASLRV